MWRLGMVAVVVVLVGAGRVDAEVITFYFTGVVTSITDANNELDDSITTGTLLSGTYSFATSGWNLGPVSDVDSVRGDHSWRNANGEGFAFDFVLGHYGFQNGEVDSGANFYLHDNRPPPAGFLEDSYIANMAFIQSSGPTFPLTVPSPEAHGSFSLHVSNQVPNNEPSSSLLTAITSTELPLVPPDISLFQSRSFSISDGLGNKVIRGEWTELSLDPGPLPPGDMNVDGDVNGLDVPLFVDALVNNPWSPRGDMDGDGVITGLDVDPFVAAVVGGAHAVPEPSTLLLALVALGIVGGWRKTEGRLSDSGRSQRGHIMRRLATLAVVDCCS